MSADYAARMDVLRRQREDIAARRKTIEKKLALREATAAEFSAVAQQTARQKAKNLRAAAATAKARNDEFVRAVREAQRRIEEARLLVMDENSPSNVALAREKTRYLRKIEQVYPAWREKEQKLRIEKLRALEERKRKLEQRRYLDKKTFEQEQTVEDLIRQTRHEIELTENLAHNEAYERELLRMQNTNHAYRVDETIREHAREARSFLHERASEQLLTIPEVDEETTEVIYDTFSPRNVLRALRDGTSAVSIQAYDDEQKMDEPRRQINITVPSLCETPSRRNVPPADDAMMGPTYEYIYVDDQDGLNQGYIVYGTQDEVAYEQPVQQPYTMEQPVRVSTSTSPAPGTFPAAQLPSASTRQEHEAAELTKPRSATTAIGRPSASTPAAVSQLGSISLTNSSAAFTAATAGVVTQQPNTLLDIKSVSPLGVNISGIQPGSTSAGGDRRMHSEPSIVAASLPNLPATRDERLTPIQFEAAAKGEEENCDRISTSKQVVNPVEPAPVRSSSGHDPNLTTSRPASETASHPATESPTTNSVCAPPQVLEEKAILPARSTMHGEVASTPATSTRNELSHSQDEQESLRPVIVTVSNTAEISTTAVPNQNDGPRRDGDMPTASTIDQPELPVAALSIAPEPTVQAPSVLPSAPTALSDGKSSEIHAGISLIGSVDSVGLSPLTSLDLSGSFFRDAETKTPLSSSPPMSAQSASVVDSVSLDTVPQPMGTSGLDSGLLPTTTDSSQLQYIPEASHESEASPLTSGTVELQSNTCIDLDSTESRTHNEPMATQEVPRDAIETNPIRAADIPGEDLSQHPIAVVPAGVHRAESIEARSTSVENELQSSVEGTTPIAKELAPTAIAMEASTAATTTAHGEPVKKLGTQHLSPADRVKALSALIARVEEGAAEGDQFGGSMDTGASNESKRELVRMAVSGRKAQIAFYGSDICFELILDIARDIGPGLFPSKAFEGIMNDQKLRKLHQQSKDREIDLWKLLSGYLKQLVALKAIAATDLVDLFLAAFLSHDSGSQRSQRKMREFLFTTCGAAPSSSPSRKDSSATPSFSPNRFDPVPSPEPTKPSLSYQEPRQQEGRIETPSLLQTAFLQHQSPPKTKTFGIATAGGYKKKSGREDDFLSSMSSTPTRLSQKLMKGGKLGDYSEFEEEEVDLQNLIGSRSARSLGGTAATSRSEPTSAASASSSRGVTAASRREDADFDVDF